MGRIELKAVNPLSRYTPSKEDAQRGQVTHPRSHSGSGSPGLESGCPACPASILPPCHVASLPGVLGAGSCFSTVRAQFVFIVRVWLLSSEVLNLVTSLGLKVREGEASENGLMAQGGGGHEQFLGPPLCASGGILPLIPSLPVCVA